jgi:hypothetical protein
MPRIGSRVAGLGIEEADERAAGAGGCLGVAEVGVDLVEALLAAGVAEELELGVEAAEEAHGHPCEEELKTIPVWPHGLALRDAAGDALAPATSAAEKGLTAASPLASIPS